MSNRKKKVLIHTNYAGAPTGNGDNVKNLLSYLFKTGKYELANYANGMPENQPDFEKFPWRTYGSLPNNQAEWQNIQSNPGLHHKCGYGFYNLDRVIQDFKPDVYISLEDFWQNTLCENINKKWWNKINCIISWTADSKPLLQDSLDLAPKIKNHYVWADFARKEFVRQAEKLEKTIDKLPENDKKDALDKVNAWKSVKSIRGMINTDKFKPLPIHVKQEIRKKFNLENVFLVGSGSRNQLRKKFDTVLEGFKLFTKNSNVKTKLLFYTDLREGWDILKMMKEYEIDNDDVLFVYKCRASGDYVLSPYIGQDIDNKLNGAEKSLVTVGINDSLRVDQINEILNILDCFTLPITSGGQEYWVYQAKLCELPTLMNNYSCFEDLFDEETGSIEIEQAFTREIGTNFLKAAPYASSLAKQLKKLYELAPEKRRLIGKTGREWVLKNASIEVIGKKWEQIIDDLSIVDYDFNFGDPVANPNAQIDIKIDDKDYLNELYLKILGREPDNQGFNHWVERLTKGENREQVEGMFRQIAAQELAKKNNTFDKLIDNTGNKKFLITLKESIGDLITVTSLLPSLKKLYNDCDIYFACDPQYKEIFDGNENVYKVIPYLPVMENEIWAVGQGEQKGLFDYYLNLGIQTQRQLNYLSRDRVVLPK